MAKKDKRFSWKKFYACPFLLVKTMDIKVRDLRKKDQYKVDDAYLNGYARLCGVYATAVYNSLSRHSDFHTQECFPSIEKIAYQHKIDKKSVIKGIRELEKWNIVKKTKEKDPKTQRQLNNIYLLIDKTQWIPKPKEDSRVDEKDTETTKAEWTTSLSRVDVEDKSRVDEKDCKDNTEEKDNTIKVLAMQSIAERKDKPIFDLIELFKPINPSYEKFFSNTTQRGAIDRLLKKIGFEKLAGAIKFLKISNGNQYAPTITTPLQLEDKFASLVIFANKEKNKKVMQEI